MTVFLTICCASLFATAPCEEDNKALFNSSPVSTESQVLVEQIEKQNEEEETVAMENMSQYLQTGMETLATLNVQPLAEHSIKSFKVEDRIIELDDGSEWTVDPSDIANLGKTWKIGHTIYISPRKGDRAKPYQLENQSINRTLKVTPFSGPDIRGPNTNWIVGIDKELGQLYLISGSNNRTSWMIDPAFLPVFKEWKADANELQEVIILSFNKSWAQRNFPRLFPSYDYVLLNVRKNSSIPAKPL